MPGVEHAPIQWAMAAANKATTMKPAAIVDHIMQGYLSTMVDWTRTGGSKVIVHFGIDRGGRTVQMHSIFSPGIHVSSRHLNDRTARIVRERPEIPNAYTIGIEHEGCSVDPRPAYSVPAEMIYSSKNPWPAAMVEASIAVKRWCFGTAPSLGTPSRDTVIGHYENGDPNRINDPAAEGARGVWPVARMLEALAPAVELTAEQAEMVALLRANRAHLTDADVAYMLGTVGLSSMPGEAPAAPPPAPPKPPPSTPSVDIAGADALLEQIVTLAGQARLKLR
jgi:hypothetical protein